MKEAYEQLTKKYSDLPSYDTLLQDYDIEGIESPFLLRKILKKMLERVESVQNMLRPVIEPDPNSAAGMFEHANLSEEERNAFFELFKKVSHCERVIHHAQLSYSEIDEVTAMKTVTRVLQEVRAEAKPLVNKLAELWQKKDAPSKEDLMYLQ